LRKRKEGFARSKKFDEWWEEEELACEKATALAKKEKEEQLKQLIADIAIAVVKDELVKYTQQQKES
jgi:hypothetical protein